MIGSFLTRGLVMVFGYAYPAYECYKTVELNKPEIEQLRFWCQYWILVAFMTVCERVGDAFVSWLPMYSEAKLAFFIYLWYPKTKGTTYVYDSFFRPYIAKHESEIDRNLLELKTRAGDIALLYWQRAASYGQTRIYDIFQYIAAQSVPNPRQTQQGNRVRPSSVTPRTQPNTAVGVETEKPASPTSSRSSSQNQKDQKDETEEAGPSQAPKPTSSAAESSTLKAAAVSETRRTQSTAAEMSSEPTQTEVESKPTEPVAPSADEKAKPPPETMMEETNRNPGGRLRKTRSTANN